MTTIHPPPPPHTLVLPPTLANWLSTFLVAGLQRFRGDVDSFKLFIRLAVMAPSISLPVFAGLSKQFEFTSAGILTSALVSEVFQKQEVSIMNRVIWMRVAAATWSSLNRWQVTLLTHGAITITFVGIMLDPVASHPAIVNMTRQFLGSRFFDDYAKLLPVDNNTTTTQHLDGESGDDDHAPSPHVQRKTPTQTNPTAQSPQTPWQMATRAFSRAFRGLCIYNFILHYAAALISRLVRTLGTRAIRGEVIMSKSVTDILIKATKEAFILNVGVSTSCFLWVLGTMLPKNASPTVKAVLGAMLAPMPLWFIEPAVVDTVYFLFTPWAARYLSRNRKSYLNLLDPRARMLLGVGILLGPLRKISDEQESYAWMVSVAFSHAQRLAGKWTGF